MKRNLLILIALLSSIASNAARKEFLVNGDFTNGLDGWEVTTGTNSSISVNGGVCNMSTRMYKDYYSDCNIRQTVTLPPGNFKCSFNFFGSLAWINSHKRVTLSKKDGTVIYSMRNDEVTGSLEFTVKDTEDYTLSFEIISLDQINFTLDNCSIQLINGFLHANVVNCTSTYGDNIPEFTINYSGFIDDDNESLITQFPTVSCEASSKSEVGTYPIILSGGVCPGYEFVYNNAELNIQKANINVSTENITREYGDDNPEIPITYNGFKNGEGESVLTNRAIVTTPATKRSSCGQYPINISGASAKNYDFTYLPSTLIVTKAPISGRIKDCEKVYGAGMPSFEIEYHGLKNEESTVQFSVQPKLVTEANNKSDVGEYSIHAENFGELKNYDIISVADGYINVLPAPLTLAANNMTRQYFENNPVLSYTATGFVNGDTKDQLLQQPKLNTNASKNSSTGQYPITISGAQSTNYNITYKPAILEITKRKLKITVNNQERKYLEDNPSFSYYYTGFVNDENEEELLLIPQIQTLATKDSDCGDYPIIASGAESDNYYFEYINGTLTIQMIEQSIIWDQKFEGIEVGDQVELLAYSSSGLAIDYILSENSCAELYKVGNKVYLDCISEGDFVIRASQEGNKNYYAAPRKSKTIHIESASGIENVISGQADITNRYTINGFRASKNTSGIIIENGKKFLIKK